MRMRFAAVMLVIALSGCAGSNGEPSASTSNASKTQNPPASASSSVEEGSSPEQTPAATPIPGVGFEPSGNWNVAESTVYGLRVRVAPSLDSPPVLLPMADIAYPYQLAAGERVLRYAPAGRKDGHVWWEIFGTPPGSDLVVHGYVAGGDGTDSWLADVDDPGCPEHPTINQLASLAPWLRVACYDRSSVSFNAYGWTIPGEGYGGACGVGFEGVFVDWLQCENINHNWVNASGNTDATFLLHYNPDALRAPDVIAMQGQLARITGHFLDGASPRCADPKATPDEQVVAYWDCATKFVVDRLELKD